MLDAFSDILDALMANLNFLLPLSGIIGVVLSQLVFEKLLEAIRANGDLLGKVQVSESK